MNWKRFLCYLGWHKPVLVTELPEKAIVAGNTPLSIPLHAGTRTANIPPRTFGIIVPDNGKLEMKDYFLEEEKDDKKEITTQACPPFWKVLLWGYPEVGIPAFRLLKNRADEERLRAMHEEAV